TWQRLKDACADHVVNRTFQLLFLFGGMATLTSGIAQTRFGLITVDPGHFHAALVQKSMYPDVDPTVHVYAPAGPDVEAHLKQIERFNSRADNPTHWKEQVYTGADFFQKMTAEKAGNIVILSGNNTRKTDYILQSVKSG